MKLKMMAAGMMMYAAMGSAMAQDTGNPDGNLAVPVVVDSTGKTVGRYVGTQVLLSHNNEVLPVGLGYIADAGGAIVSAAWTWAFSQLYYQTEDCSGTAYVTGVSGGRSYVAVQPQGNQYVGYLAQAASYAPVALRAYRSYFGLCSAWSEEQILPAAPVQATIPMDSFGIPPFYVR